MSNNAYGYQTPQTYQIPTEDRTAAALAHFSTIIAMVISVGWLSFAGPLLMWLMYKDRSRYVRHAAAGAFNFNIWANLMMIVGQVLCYTLILLPVGIPMILIAAFLMLWTHTRAGLRALQGGEYSYRHQLRILS